MPSLDESQCVLHRLLLTDMTYHGAAVGRLDGQVVFAYYGLPGDEVMVAVEERHRSYLLGKVVEVLLPSPRRAFAPCPYFGECGGCQWQQADYAYQLEMKRDIVRNQLRRLGGLVEVEVLPLVPSPRIWHYHNHARFVADPAGQLGFRRLRGREVIYIGFCWIMHLPISRALEKLQRFSYTPGQTVVVRAGIESGDMLVQPRLSGPGDLPTGQPYLEEQLLGRRYRVSADSFFQVNILQAEQLVRLVADGLEPEPRDHLLDLYGGVGTFGLALADRVERITSVEEFAPAVEDARYNARDLDNVRIRLGRAEEVVKGLKERIDCAVVDPPRCGCAPSVLRALAALGPSRIAYVSCDPATLARDLGLLVGAGYEVASVRPIDMFPQTFHIETVAVLRRQRPRSRRPAAGEKRS